MRGSSQRVMSKCHPANSHKCNMYMCMQKHIQRQRILTLIRGQRWGSFFICGLNGFNKMGTLVDGNPLGINALGLPCSARITRRPRTRIDWSLGMPVDRCPNRWHVDRCRSLFQLQASRGSIDVDSGNGAELLAAVTAATAAD